jgi:hypothetical protein
MEALCYCFVGSGWLALNRFDQFRDQFIRADDIEFLEEEVEAFFDFGEYFIEGGLGNIPDLFLEITVGALAVAIIELDIGLTRFPV